MRRYSGSLRAYFRATGADESVLNDMIWDAWALAAESEGDILDCLDPWPILRDLARLLAREWTRWVRHERMIIDASVVGLVQGDGPLVSSDHGAHEDQLAKWLMAALACLSPRQRAVIELRCGQSIPDDKLARVLGIRESTLRVHAMRGLERLREYAKNHPPPKAGGGDAGGPPCSNAVT